MSKFIYANRRTFIPSKRGNPTLSLNSKTKHSAWGDIPTILEEIVENFCVKRDKALEFGVEWGYSTSAISNYFKSVTGVDTFTGDIHSSYKNDHFQETKTYLSEFKNINLIQSTYQDFTSLNNDMYDFIHIDIIHTYEDTYRCGLWSIEHSPVVVFHDTLSFPDVLNAVSDLSTQNGLDFYNYPGSHGLGILVKQN